MIEIEREDILAADRAIICNWEEGGCRPGGAATGLDRLEVEKFAAFLRRQRSHETRLATLCDPDWLDYLNVHPFTAHVMMLSAADCGESPSI